MANNSAKKNQQNIRTTIICLTWAVYILIGWFMLFNIMFLISETISIWHFLLCILISGASYFCLKQIIRCWELQLPSGAADYYYDVLAMNLLVQVFDPYTHTIWNVYWLILVFVLIKGGQWLWDYITPKYVEEQQGESTEQGNKKKDKKDKKQKIKYVKK